MNTFLKAKSELADVVAARAGVMVKLNHKQQELVILKADMVNNDAEGLCVNRYNTARAQVEALKDVVKDYEDNRLPQADAKVRREKSIVMAAVSKYLQEKKIAAVPAIQKKFNEAVKLMDKYSKEVAEYVSANGNVLLVGRKLKDITLFDMDVKTKKRLI